MEQRRIDPLQIIGMVLIFAIFTWMMYTQPPVEDVATPATTEEAQPEQLDSSDSVVVAAQTKRPETTTPVQPQVVVDTLTLENDVLKLAISTKGGVMSQVG